MPAPAHTPKAPPRLAPAPPTLPNELLNLVQQLTSSLSRLDEGHIPTLAQCSASLSEHEQLAQDIRHELGHVRKDLEELKLQVDDLDKARDRRAGADHVVQVQLRLDASTKMYRQAVIASKRLIDALAGSGAHSSFSGARDDLSASVSSRTGKFTASAGRPESPASSNVTGGAAADGVVRRDSTSSARSGNGLRKTAVASALGASGKQKDTPDDALMAATSDMTDGLRRTLQLMQQEVDRSLVSNEMLEAQTATMQLTSDSYSTLSTLLHTSRALIGALERADLLDRLILLAAFVLFGLTCAWILKRRVVDKGIRIASALGGVVTGGSSKDSAAGAAAVIRDGSEAVVVAASVVTSLVASVASIVHHTARPRAVHAGHAVFDRAGKVVSRGKEQVRAQVVEPVVERVRRSGDLRDQREDDRSRGRDRDRDRARIRGKGDHWGDDEVVVVEDPDVVKRSNRHEQTAEPTVADVVDDEEEVEALEEDHGVPALDPDHIGGKPIQEHEEQDTDDDEDLSSDVIELEEYSSDASPSVTIATDVDRADRSDESIPESESVAEDGVGLQDPQDADPSHVVVDTETRPPDVELPTPTPAVIALPVVPPTPSEPPLPTATSDDAAERELHAVPEPTTAPVQEDQSQDDVPNDDDQVQAEEAAGSDSLEAEYEQDASPEPAVIELTPIETSDLGDEVTNEPAAEPTPPPPASSSDLPAPSVEQDLQEGVSSSDSSETVESQSAEVSAGADHEESSELLSKPAETNVESPGVADSDLGLDNPVLTVFRNSTPTFATAEVDEKIFTPLASFRPATPDLGEPSDNVVAEHEVHDIAQEQPRGQDAIANEAVVDEAVVDEAVVDEAVVEQPNVDAPVVDEAANHEPVVAEPVVDEPVADDPLTNIPSNLIPPLAEDEIPSFMPPDASENDQVVSYTDEDGLVWQPVDDALKIPAGARVLPGVNGGNPMRPVEDLYADDQAAADDDDEDDERDPYEGFEAFLRAGDDDDDDGDEAGFDVVQEEEDDDLADDGNDEDDGDEQVDWDAMPDVYDPYEGEPGPDGQLRSPAPPTRVLDSLVPDQEGDAEEEEGYEPAADPAPAEAPSIASEGEPVVESEATPTPIVATSSEAQVEQQPQDESQTYDETIVQVADILEGSVELAEPEQALDLAGDEQEASVLSASPTSIEDFADDELFADEDPVAALFEDPTTTRDEPPMSSTEPDAVSDAASETVQLEVEDPVLEEMAGEGEHGTTGVEDQLELDAALADQEPPAGADSVSQVERPAEVFEDAVSGKEDPQAVQEPNEASYLDAHGDTEQEPELRPRDEL